MLSVGGLFDGAGLLACGLHQAGLRHAWLCEWDPWRRELLRQRFPGIPVYDDVRAVGAANAVRPDVIAGGFPCKGVSSAGKREGFGHPETVLWREMRRCVDELRPRYVVVENVAAILGLHDGDVWGEVVGDLAALGYDTTWDVLPAAAVGAPHLRERAFAIACHADGAGWPSGRQPEHPEHGGPRHVADEVVVAAAAADASRDAEGGTGTTPRTDGQRVGACAGAAPDADGARREGHGGTFGVRAQVAGATADGADAPADTHNGVLGDRCGGVEGQEAGGERGDARADWRPTDSRRGGVAVDWGQYGPAVHRWEAVHGPAPEPLIRRLDDGDAALQRLRARVDRSRLSALGDGVHVYVARLVGQRLIELEQERRMNASLTQRPHQTDAITPQRPRRAAR